MVVPVGRKEKIPGEWKALGVTPEGTIHLLASIEIDGLPVIPENSTLLNLQSKAEKVMNFFKEKFNLLPQELPYLASMITKDLKVGKLNFGT